MVNIILIVFCFEQSDGASIYWAPFLMYEIVINFCIEISLFLEAAFLPYNQKIWKYEYKLYKELYKIKFTKD